MTSSGKGTNLAVRGHKLRQFHLYFFSPCLSFMFFWWFFCPLWYFPNTFCGFSSWKKTRFVCTHQKELCVQPEGAGTAVLSMLLHNLPCLTLSSYSHINKIYDKLSITGEKVGLTEWTENVSPNRWINRGQYVCMHVCLNICSQHMLAMGKEKCQCKFIKLFLTRNYKELHQFLLICIFRFCVAVVFICKKCSCACRVCH